MPGPKVTFNAHTTELVVQSAESYARGIPPRVRISLVGKVIHPATTKATEASTVDHTFSIELDDVDVNQLIKALEMLK